MILVIHELDLSDNEETIIGVASCKEEAEEMIKTYYGSDLGELLGFRDVRDSGIEYEYRYLINGCSANYKVVITLMSFELDKI